MAAQALQRRQGDQVVGPGQEAQRRPLPAAGWGRQRSALMAKIGLDASADIVRPQAAA